MQNFTSSKGYAVRSRESEDYPFIVSGNDGDFLVSTLKDECSCAAIQGISCEHKEAVDEYVAATTVEELGHEPGHEHKEEPTTEPQTEHRPSYKREQVGMTETTPARPLWETTVTCSCGWQVTESTKDGAKTRFRAHRDGSTLEAAAEAVSEEPSDQLHQNREDWLHAAKLLWWERFSLFDVAYPTEVRVGVGFTYSRKKGHRGECWSKESSADRTFEVIISNQWADPAQVMRTLGHELVHTACPPGSGHGREFSTRAKAVGFKRAFSDSANTTEELETWIKEALEKLGRYPHAELEPKMVREGGPKRQTNRWVKYHCSVPECGWIIRSPKPGFVGACLSPSHYDVEANEGTIGVMLPGFETEEEPPTIERL